MEWSLKEVERIREKETVKDLDISLTLKNKYNKVLVGQSRVVKGIPKLLKCT
jgi:hypothetical protein